MLIRNYKVDSLEVKMFDTRESLGNEAGKEAADCLRDLLSEKDKVCVIFAAAPSQNEFLETLTKEEGIDWPRIHALHMDEYVGLRNGAPESFGQFLDDAIFGKVPFGKVDYIGLDGTPEEKMERYTRVFNENHIDVVFMGIGENGHIAFNDPHVADFDDPVLIKMVDLDKECRLQQVHDGCFKMLDDVPRFALTLTVPALFSADRLFCIVPAATKADAVRTTLYGPVSEACPASIIRRHPHATLYLDSDSGRYI